MRFRTQDAPPARRSWLDRSGIHPPLAWGYLGLFLFMTGDGIETGYLSKYLDDRNIVGPSDAAVLFTVYGVAVAVAAWLSGALSDLWGPRRVMGAGVAIWVVFEIAFLAGLGIGNYPLILIAYSLRGLGYPLFAFGFLVWVTVVTPGRQLGTAVGWFWFAFTGGLLALGPLLASVLVEPIGSYETLWGSLGLVALGGLVALLGVREPTGRRRLAPVGEHPLRTLVSSVSIAWREPKTAIGCVVRVINTAPQNGFVVFLPFYFTQTIGFSQPEWLRLLSSMFLSNIIWNLLFGVIGDRLGWRRTVALCGGLGSAVATLLLYFVPATFGANYPLAVLTAVLYGATLAGYVPLSALVPSLTPAHKGAAMSLLNLGAGASNWVGPAVVALFLPAVGVGGVMGIYAGLYVVSAVLTAFLHLPSERARP